MKKKKQVRQRDKLTRASRLHGGRSAEILLLSLFCYLCILYATLYACLVYLLMERYEKVEETSETAGRERERVACKYFKYI